ncbi:MAG: hypothetical protein KBS45_04590, partial [Clostridiales bacterium]|nr:hypothetical protein [Candidatus Coliplasma caballi]
MKKILPILLALLLCASLVLPALAEENFSEYFSLCGTNVQRLYQTEKPVTITAGFAGTLQNYGLRCYHSVTVAENVSLSMRDIRTSDGATLRINSGATVSAKELFVGDRTNVIVYGKLILPEATGSWCCGTIEVCEGGMLKIPYNEENTANIDSGKVQGTIEIKTEGGKDYYIVTAPATSGSVLSGGSIAIIVGVSVLAAAAV